MDKMKWFTGATLVASLLIAGCTNNTNDAEDTGSSDRVEIRFASWDNEASLDRQQELVDEFNESQNEIAVNLEGYGTDFDTSITAGMGAGDAPDVMYMWNYPLYHEGLEPLDDYIASEGEEYKDNFYETTWNYNSIDDVTYGIPIGFTTHALYYNKDIFDEAGVEYPDDTWSWDDLRSASEQISNSEENQYGLVLPINPDPYDFEMFFWSNGSAYVDENGETEGILNAPESVEVLEMFQGYLQDEIAVGSDDYGQTEMEAETASMMISGAWEIETFTDTGLNYGIAPIPSHDGEESVSVLSSSGIAMSADTEEKDAAWEFIKYWTNEELNRARLDYELPVLENVVEEEGLEEEERGVFYTMLERSEDYNPASFIVDDWSTLSDDLSYVFESVFNPTTFYEPQEALDNVAN